MTGDNPPGRSSEEADRDTIGVTTAVADGDPIETKEVDAEMMELFEQAERVREKVHAEYRDRKGVIGTGVTKTDDEIDGMRVPAVLLEITDEADRTELPDAVDGVPIKYHESDNPEGTPL